MVVCDIKEMMIISRVPVRSWLFACVCCLLFLTACQGEVGQPVNSMYYWSTVMRMDSAKVHFLQQHHVGKLYVRYFDVVVDDMGEVKPNATIRLRREGEAKSPTNADAIPDNLEVIPTIFIVNDVMRKHTDGLADLILKRVLQMNETHGVRHVSEIQIDCDWSVNTRQHFFAFMKELHQKANDKGLQLSATIRLHQLAQKPPSCDKGVLMMYNTGDFTKYADEHPILDMQVAGPYLKYLKNYKLPLSTAYPIFGWDVVFRKVNVRSTLTHHPTPYPSPKRGGEKVSPLTPQYIYIGIQHFAEEIPVMPGDTIVRRQPTVQEILQARKAIEEIRPDANREVILFDLNNSNVTRFTTKEYEEIFGH